MFRRKVVFTRRICAISPGGATTASIGQRRDRAIGEAEKGTRFSVCPAR